MARRTAPLTDQEVPASIARDLELSGRPSRGGIDDVAFAGITGSGVSDDTTALQAVHDAAAAANRATYMGPGDYRITSTLTIKGDFLCSPRARILCDGANPALLISDAVGRRTIQLPEVVQQTKVWEGATPTIGEDVGVHIGRLQTCQVWIPLIQNFSEGLTLAPTGNYGVAYNDFYVGHIDNCARSQVLSPAQGWTNENHFYVRRCSHNSIEGTNVVGTRKILIEDPGVNQPNNNTWFGGSLEGDVAEYQIDCDGVDNRFVQMRYEVTGGAKVRWGPSSQRNWIDGGYDSERIAEIWATGANKNSIKTGDTERRLGAAVDRGVLILENVSSNAYPALTIVRAGSTKDGHAPETNWSVELGPNEINVKRDTDVEPRLSIDCLNGRIKVGNGSVVPAATLGAIGSLIGLRDSHLAFTPDGTYDLGTGVLRPRDLNVTRKVAFSVGPSISAGSGSPEGVVTATVGSSFHRSDGGAGTSFYVKESGTGNTGWVPK